MGTQRGPHIFLGKVRFSAKDSKFGPQNSESGAQRRETGPPASSKFWAPNSKFWTQVSKLWRPRLEVLGPRLEVSGPRIRSLRPRVRNLGPWARSLFPEFAILISTSAKLRGFGSAKPQRLRIPSPHVLSPAIPIFWGVKWPRLGYGCTLEHQSKQAHTELIPATALFRKY